MSKNLLPSASAGGVVNKNKDGFSRIRITDMAEAYDYFL